ncbi:7072_t:CDS:2 [Acaulospora morrowiae]|uniref:7072_t:CDS:1 n=1 Tax=Acaulospora morrowiae TaxID=94023 RepID=A0A9N9BMK2_9GLOM|nr:7072_t:CDS:2 [Acaulospora morrowiae]
MKVYRNRSNGNQSNTSQLQLTHIERKYVRHILKLFEEGKDINKEKINIKDAINYVSEAWSHVTENTIWNCWRKTGILPFLTNEEMNNATQIQQEAREHKIADINQIVEDLNKTDSYVALLVDALNNFFNDLEKKISTEAILSKNDIIKLIRKEMEEVDENDKSEEEPMLISFGDAVKSLTNWITFFEQLQSDEFKTKDIDVFKKYLFLT